MNLIDVDFTVCASPEYFAKNGVPKTPEDLINHNVIAYTRNKGAHEWQYETSDGKFGTTKLSSGFKADSAVMMIEASLNDIGIIIMPTLLHILRRAAYYF